MLDGLFGADKVKHPLRFKAMGVFSTACSIQPMGKENMVSLPPHHHLQQLLFACVLQLQQVQAGAQVAHIYLGGAGFELAVAQALEVAQLA